MEPNKLENEIREKLGKREIQPSTQAWDRLDAMLSVQESKAVKKPFPWMKIAVGIVLFLGVGYFVFNSDKTEVKVNNDVIQIVENSKESSVKEIEKHGDKVVKSSEEIIDKNNQHIVYSESKESALNNDRNTEQLKKNKEEETLITTSNKNQIAHSDVKTEEKIFDSKIEEKSIQDNKQVIAEVDKPIEKPKLRIDPNALLDQVDGEIQLTFRQKVMKKVAKGYKQTKEAVASRNQESSINHQSKNE